MRRIKPVPLLLACAILWFGPVTDSAAWDLAGTKSVIATTADGQRIRLGSVRFVPVADGAFRFALSLDTGPFDDHFLSMREFKCIAGRTELSCHVPYPYAHPGVVRPGQLAWLEHSLLFFYKRPADFGAKLWNGLYFALQATENGLVGTPKAVDLNLIAAPPADATVPPFGPALRHDLPADARWLQRLSIE